MSPVQSSVTEPVFVYPEDILVIAKRNYFDGQDDPKEAALYLLKMHPEIGRAAMHLLDIHTQLTILVEQVGLMAVASWEDTATALDHAADMSAVLLKEDIDDQIQGEGVLGALTRIYWETH